MVLPTVDLQDLEAIFEDFSEGTDDLNKIYRTLMGVTLNELVDELSLSISTQNRSAAVFIARLAWSLVARRYHSFAFPPVSRVETQQVLTEIASYGTLAQYAIAIEPLIEKKDTNFVHSVHLLQSRLHDYYYRPDKGTYNNGIAFALYQAMEKADAGASSAPAK